MKYIRVCDEYENEYITTYQQHCEDVANMQDSGFDFEGCITKQADTIEELCDEFVLETQGTHIPVCLYKNKYGFKFDEEPRTFTITNVDKIYGAIWTNKGLIYVAKMNDKGELELL